MSGERYTDIDADILQCKLDIVRIRQGILNSGTRDAVVEFRPEDSIGMGALVDEADEDTDALKFEASRPNGAVEQPTITADPYRNIYTVTRQEQQALMAEEDPGSENSSPDQDQHQQGEIIVVFPQTQPRDPGESADAEPREVPLKIGQNNADQSRFDIVVGELQGEEAIVPLDDEENAVAEIPQPPQEDVPLRIVQELRAAAAEPQEARAGIPKLDLSRTALSRQRSNAAATRRSPARKAPETPAPDKAASASKNAGQSPTKRNIGKNRRKPAAGKSAPARKDASETPAKPPVGKNPRKTPAEGKTASEAPQIAESVTDFLQTPPARHPVAQQTPPADQSLSDSICGDPSADEQPSRQKQVLSDIVAADIERLLRQNSAGKNPSPGAGR